MKNRRSIVEWIADTIIVLLVLFAIIITLYPFLYVFSMSISDPLPVMRQEVRLFPKGFSTAAYQLVIQNDTIWQSYYNTIWYTVVGTCINVILTMFAAYTLSIKEFFLRVPILMMITFTMFFSGGMIPMFILINQLGLYNTRWAMVLPGAVGAWYIIITRTFLNSTIPDSLRESAKIDGANDIIILFRIIIPLCMPILSVLILFYAVGHWNSFFNALLYLPSGRLHPLQIFLRRILIFASDELTDDASYGLERSAAVIQLRYAAIMITVLPILFVYPFLQKYFIKGILIGSVKG